MKILIDVLSKRKKRIYIPNFLITSKGFLRNIINSQLKVEFSKEEIRNLRRSLRKFIYDHRPFELVSVETASGEKVKIIL